MAVWLGDLNVSRTMAQVPHPYREKDAADFVAAAHSPARGRYAFSILRAADGLFLGVVGLNEDGGDVELGYWLGRPFWGQGMATEAVRRLVAYAFDTLGMTQLKADWFHDNPASGRVLAKLGAMPVGTALRECRARKTMVPAHAMRLTRADFLRKRAA
jgi:RimJ/RimL family protein N-acetyltransferase